MARRKNPNAKMGQPVKYREEYCQKIIEYFSVEPYREILKKVVTKQGDVIEVPVLEASDMPSFAGFACEINVHRETLINWTKSYPDFSEAYKRAKELQEHWIITNGNKGLINTVFAIFTAKNVLRWTDRFEQKSETKFTSETSLKVEASKEVLSELKNLLSNEFHERRSRIAQESKATDTVTISS